jgi:hypothetical protein
LPGLLTPLVVQFKFEAVAPETVRPLKLVDKITALAGLTKVNTVVPVKMVTPKFKAKLLQGKGRERLSMFIVI